MKESKSEEELMMATVPFSCKTVEDAVLYHMQMMRERCEEYGRDSMTLEPMNKVEQIAVRIHDEKEMDKFIHEIDNSNFLNIDEREDNEGNSLPSNDGSESLLQPGKPQEQPPPSSRAMRAMETLMEKVTKEK